MSKPSTSETAATAQRSAGDSLRIALGVGGLIAFVLGLLVLFAPAPSAKAAAGTAAALLALYALITGVVYVGTSIFSKTLGGWARTGHVLLGVLYIVGGVIMMSNLLATGTLVFLFITITIGVLWLFEGIMAFSLVSKSENKVWGIIYGVISVLAGLTMMFSPLLSAAVLWIMLGASMVVLGAAQSVRAFMMKSNG
ncbi:DUF308 domain-containing protein [Leucobacter sp. gxy201]|uniref:HdeD family acid-resistance protein n=1 Tax=Leucobacter sp. gxy201 TaxID=2957200 RepID=UPI003DA17971